MKNEVIKEVQKEVKNEVQKEVKNEVQKEVKKENKQITPKQAPIVEIGEGMCSGSKICVVQ
jgi:hypothetical protein